MNTDSKIYVTRRSAGLSETAELCSHRDYVVAFNEMACILLAWSMHVLKQKGLGGEHYSGWPAVEFDDPVEYMRLAQDGTSALANGVGNAMYRKYWPHGVDRMKGMKSTLSVFDNLAQLAHSGNTLVILHNSKIASLRARLNDALVMMHSLGLKASQQQLISKMVQEFECCHAFISTTFIPEVELESESPELVGDTVS
jgi:hypothetical protein